MSRNRWIIIFISLFFLILVMFKISAGSKKYDLVEKARLDSEAGRFCEAMEEALIALNTNEAVLFDIVAGGYARGLCVRPDLERAIIWWKKAALKDEAIGKSIFYAAMWEASDEVNSKSHLTREQIIELFKKSKSLGFSPSENELAKFCPEYARSIFQSK